MNKSCGIRIVTEHGLVSNILPSLTFMDRLILGCLTTRTYEITIPWNTQPVKLPAPSPKNYPNLFLPFDFTSSKYSISRVDLWLEGWQGLFYGRVEMQTRLPAGAGVFLTGDWIHCGIVENSAFTGGKKVIANIQTGGLETVSWM